MFKPVFFDDELVGWTAVKGHQADIGGAVAGGYNPNAVEVWQEALRIPAVKVVERGKLRQDVWDLIFANMRLDIVQHDMKAEMGACTVGERRLVELLRKYGVASFRAHKQALFDATRRMMEAEIAQDPERASTAARATSTTTAATRARSSRSGSTSRCRTSASSSTTREPTRRPTASSTAPSRRARRRPS